MKKLLTVIAVTIVFLGGVFAQEAAPTPEELQAMAEKVRMLGLPEGVVQLSPCVPGMGEHWADPQNMPFGPIYGVYEDQVRFVEIMVAQADFAEGESWTETLMPLPGQTIDHVDIEFEPQGHDGYEIPHYDIHAYFVPHSEHVEFCPPSQ